MPGSNRNITKQDFAAALDDFKREQDITRAMNGPAIVDVPRQKKKTVIKKKVSKQKAKPMTEKRKVPRYDENDPFQAALKRRRKENDPFGNEEE